MCTWLTDKIAASGCGRGVPEWISVTQVNVSYDHPAKAPLEHAVLIDFVNPSQGVGARIAVELSATSALELARAIEQALGSPEAVRDLRDQITPVAATGGSRA